MKIHNLLGLCMACMIMSGCSWGSKPDVPDVPVRVPPSQEMVECQRLKPLKSGDLQDVAEGMTDAVIAYDECRRRHLELKKWIERGIDKK